MLRSVRGQVLHDSAPARPDPPARWCSRSQRQELLHQTIQKQLYTHAISGYGVLANQWRSRVAPSMEAFKAAGIPVRAQGQGKEVFIRGQWMKPWSGCACWFI